jgi:hypothetical protein
MDIVVTPTIVRLPLQIGGEEFFVDVKRRLNTGERRRLVASVTSSANPGERAVLRTADIQIAAVLAYLIAWNLTSDGCPTGEPIPMQPEPQMSLDDRRAVLDSLDPDAFDAIFNAIDAHETKVTEEMAARKKPKGGDNNGSQISPSALTSTGPLNTSSVLIPTTMN